MKQGINYINAAIIGLFLSIFSMSSLADPKSDLADLKKILNDKQVMEYVAKMKIAESKGDLYYVVKPEFGSSEACLKEYPAGCKELKGNSQAFPSATGELVFFEGTSTFYPDPWLPKCKPGYNPLGTGRYICVRDGVKLPDLP